MTTVGTSSRRILNLDSIKNPTPHQLGDGASIVQVEFDYFDDHNSIANTAKRRLTDPPPTRHLFRQLKRAIHATAVASIISNDRFGVAPRVSHMFCGFEDVEYPKYGLNHALAHIRSASHELGVKSGDLVSISLQIKAEGTSKYFPVDSDPTTARAIRALTKAGFIVVIAAGNDRIDLGKEKLRRTGEEVPYMDVAGDSGAIRVAYTNATMTGTELSNFGSCVDLFAPAGNVKAACHDYSRGDKRGDLLDSFTAGFARTSAATPMVSAALACIQASYRHHNQGASLDREQLLTLVRETGRRPWALRKPIGVMPDVAKATEKVRLGWKP